MLVSTTQNRRLAAIATICLLSVALPTAPAWAQKTKTKDAAPTQTSTPSSDDASMLSEIAVDIPDIEAVGSNVDDEVLRDILSGNIAGNAEALAGLTAESITIPLINVTGTTTIEEDTTETTVKFNDIVLTDVVDGTAATITLSSTSSQSDDASAEFGSISAANFDIAGVLGIYGLVDGGPQTELETIYTDFTFGGGTFTAPELECTIGAAEVAELKARPLNYSFAEIMALGEALEESEGDEMPDPKLIGDAMRMYADLLTAFETSPATFEGFECSGTDDDDRPIAFSVAGMSMGGMSPGLYPSYSVEGLDIQVEDDGSVAVGSLVFKGMDLSGPLAAIASAPEAVDEAWFTQNARALIPAFEGFSISDVAVDVPDPELPDQRIVGGVGAFDLTLGDYLNGIPTTISTTATNIVADIPEDTQDEQLTQLKALGVTSLDLGFALEANWDEAANAIELTELSVTGADLATVKLAGTIANATEALFGIDNDAALVAAMGIAIADLQLDVTDTGLSDIILSQVAAEQGSDPAAMRPIFAGLAEGTVVGILAGAAEAQKVGAALNSFVSGKAKSLAIDLVAKDQPGLGLADFMAAETDPTILIGKVTINATAK